MVSACFTYILQGRNPIRVVRDASEAMETCSQLLLGRSQTHFLHRGYETVTQKGDGTGASSIRSAEELRTNAGDHLDYDKSDIRFFFAYGMILIDIV
jgi:hypothetical protein